ncbi:D-alanyl-D-alanine carboxypeptidase/D-alanyl-D-alanine endopeptidase [Sunxiuqinia indica]|uniref:D-alanyl-D-alanine carboxypeptidase/D-alanyl-D-alanine endopeptidase n=1 Tax=Sunxiuqinia indica TaxID=2692584 RepID=UPI001358CB0D|nr:D-alanyl-D-alanine carboxypeptidase/D-alanyl-D-alanine-endopeptidase [Sunxiuqinia indica]
MEVELQKCPMQKLIHYLVIILSLSFPATSNAQGQDWSLKDEITLWKSNDYLKHAGIGIYLQNAETGEVLAETDPQLSLAPGSTLKLVTTATAIEILGSDFRFETELCYSGEIKHDTLFGDLIIVGGADPALGSKYFKEHYLKNHFLDEWSTAVKELNISHITGNLITDATIFEEQMVPNTWIWEDLGNYYGAGASGISVYDNMYQIHFSSPAVAGELTTLKYTKPFIPNLEINNEVRSSDVNRDLAYVFGAPMVNQRTIRGTIPKGRNDFIIKASVPNPPYLLAWNFKSRLSDAQITLGGLIESQQSNLKDSSTHLIAKTTSPPLLDIIRVTNHESVNLFAEHLLKYLAYMIHGQGSTKKGIDVITDFWEKRGIDMDGLFMADGSGLSHFNCLTAKQMVQIMYYMKNQSPEGENWFSSLPYVPDGTLYYFNPINFPGKTLRAKSGSMTRVRCYAGELITHNKQPILFAIFLNNFNCKQSQAIKLVEGLLVTISKN